MPFIDTLSKFFSSTGGNLITSIADTIDRFVTNPQEKAQFQQELMKLQEQQKENERKFMTEMESLTQQRESEIEQTIRAELQAKKEILVAELNQGDNYTKRARPTVIYVGLVFIGLEVFGVRHLIMHHLGVDKDIIMSSDDIFKDFLFTWGGIMGVYSIGRSMEKRGTRNAWTRAITGSPDDTDTRIEDTLAKDIVRKVDLR